MNKQEIEARLFQIKEQKVALIKNHKAQFYTPIGKGEEFIQNFSTGFVNGYIAANGVGKTALLGNIVANICFGVQNEYFDYPIFRKFPYLKRGRIISDPTTITSTIIPTLEEWLPAGRYKKRKGNKHYDSIWTTDTGFTFDILSFDQDPKEFESATLGWALEDEPPPELVHRATIARMRRGGVIGLFCTPLTGSAWLFDEFATLTPQELRAKKKTLVTAGAEDACITHGVRGFLKHSDIENMRDNLDADEIKPRLFGKFAHLSGLVFKKWKPSLHVIEPFHINEKDFVVIEALDTHPRTPDAYIQVAIDREGTKYVIYEISHTGSTEALADKIKKAREGKRIIKSLIEPAAFVEDQHKENETLNSLAKELASYGLFFVPGSKRRTDAVRRIRDALNYSSDAAMLTVAPELYFFETVPNTIYEMGHWQWSEWTGKTKEKKSPSERPEDKNDHFIEDLGRILLEEPEFEEDYSDVYLGETNKLDPY